MERPLFGLIVEMDFRNTVLKKKAEVILEMSFEWNEIAKEINLDHSCTESVHKSFFSYAASPTPEQNSIFRITI